MDGTTYESATRRPVRLSRRTVLRLGLGAAGSAAIGAVLTACGSGDDGGPNLFEADPATDDADLEALFDEWLEHHDPIEITELDVERLVVELQGESYEVWAYENTWVGEVDDEADLDDCVDKIRFRRHDGELTGTLTLLGQDPRPFVARPSTGDAGLHRTETIEVGEIGFTPRWIVLPDGRQRGGRKCRNPWTGDCMWCPVPK